MSSRNPPLDPNSSDYRSWLADLNTRVRKVQIQAAVSVNEQLLRFYWELGADLVARQQEAAWGSGFLKQLSQDLRAEFPDMKGFSFSNIKYIRQWFRFYACPAEKSQQAVGLFRREPPPPQILKIPWGHNLALISRCTGVSEALFYAENVVEHGWSRSVLQHQIELDLWHREGKAQSNFARALPAPQSDLASQTLKSIDVGATKPVSESCCARARTTRLWSMR